MKYSLFFIALSISFHYSYGQKVIDYTQFESRYRYLYTKDTLTHNMEDDLLILQIGKNTSKCYSYYSNQTDSIFALPNMYETMKGVFNDVFLKKEVSSNDYPHKRMKTYVYKNYPKGKMTVTDGINLQDYIYEEELNTQDWQIQDSIKTVLGYSCQKAECDFRSRHWTAWFTSDIPVSDGPWKFSGLPGLIMEVYDKGQQYYFSIIGLQKIEDKPIIFSKTYVGSKKFEKTDRKDFLKAKKKYLMNMSGYIELETGINLGNNTSQKVMRYDLLERDYK